MTEDHKQSKDSLVRCKHARKVRVCMASLLQSIPTSMSLPLKTLWTLEKVSHSLETSSTRTTVPRKCSDIIHQGSHESEVVFALDSLN